MPAMSAPAPEAQELKEQAKEEDEEDDAEDGSEKAKETSAKAAPVPAMCARNEIGRHRCPIGMTCEHAHQKPLGPARIIDCRADAQEDQGGDADNRQFG